MKGRLKKILSFLLVIGLVGGMCQIPAEKSLAATLPVKLDLRNTWYHKDWQ